MKTLNPKETFRNSHCIRLFDSLAGTDRNSHSISAQTERRIELSTPISEYLGNEQKAEGEIAIRLSSDSGAEGSRHGRGVWSHVLLGAAVVCSLCLSPLYGQGQEAARYAYNYKGTQVVLVASTRLLAMEEGGLGFSEFITENGLVRDKRSDHHALAGKGLGLYRVREIKKEAALRLDLPERTRSFSERAGRVWQPVFEQGSAILIPSDEVVVGFKASTTLPQASDYLLREAATQGIIDVRPHRKNTFLIRIDAPSNARSFLVSQFLSRLNAVAFAEPNETAIMSHDVSAALSVEAEYVGQRLGAGPADKGVIVHYPMQAIPTWIVIGSVDCESETFPPTGWSAYAVSGYTNAYWGRTAHISREGTSSTYCALSGTAGVTPPGPVPVRMKADLDSPIYDLTGYEEVYLEVWFYAKNELSGAGGTLYDYCTVYVINNGTGAGAGLKLASLASGDCTIDPTTANGWRKCLFRVPPAYRIANAYFKFRHVTDISISVEGCYLDGIRIVGTDNVDTEPLGDDTYSARHGGHRNVGQVAELGNDENDLYTPEAWNLIAVSTNIVVAVIDEGVDTNHPDLNVVSGYDYNGAIGGQARGSHGTACAGQVGARRDNGIGVIGTAPGVRIMSVYKGTSWPADYANAIDVAVSHGARVFSDSWGLNPGSSSDLESAIDDAISAGCVLLFAAGNGPDRSPWNYNVAFPGNLTGSKDIICVGASSPTDEHKGVASSDGEYGWGSSYVGDGPDVVAPGPWSYTTDRLGANGYNVGGGIETGDNGNYTHAFSGTSAATPKVAGIVALMLSKNPNLTPAQVKTILRNSADDVGPAGIDDMTGAGRVNAYQALLNTPPPSNITIDDVTVTEGNAGTTNAVFTVSLSAASGQTVTVNYASDNGTATAGSDYVATNGTLTLPAGITTTNVTMLVNGDTFSEANETFFVNLSRNDSD